MITDFVLTQGPSREQLFDCLKLGPAVGELRVLDFWGKYKNKTGKGGSLLPIEIQGLHQASNDDILWFFWGRRKQITSGDRWVPMWESKYVDFAFGMWNTHSRRGAIKLGETSFFISPVSVEELLNIHNSNI